MKSVVIDMHPSHATCLGLLSEFIDIDEAAWDFSLDVLQLSLEWQLMGASKNAVRPSNTLQLLEQQLSQTIGLSEKERAKFMSRLTDAIIVNICRHLQDLKLSQVHNVNWLTRTLVVITYETKVSNR